MRVRDTFELALAALWAHRLRSVLGAVGIAVGIAAMVTISGLGVGFDRYLVEQFRGFGTDLVVFGEEAIGSGGRPLIEADVEAIRQQIQGVSRLSGFIQEQGRATWGSRGAPCRLYGMDPDLAGMLNIPIVRGRLFTSAEARSGERRAVVGEALARELFGILDPVGQRLFVNDQELTVVGVASSIALRGYLGEVERAVLLPLPVARGLLGAVKTSLVRVDAIYLEAAGGELKTVVFQTTNLLRLRHGVGLEDDFYVGSNQEALDLYRSVARALVVALGILATVALVVGAVGVATITLVSVNERKREIGVARALGATRFAVALQFALEAGLVALLGGVVGSAVGWSLVALVQAFTPVPARVPDWALPIAWGVALGVGVASATLPAAGAARLDPIQTLRSE